MKETCPKHTRLLVAQQAARIMADEGIADYWRAKRKAARQLGLPEDHCLPSNAEVEQAIREHHEIFHVDTHAQHLQRLRQTALDVMRNFAQFDPHLTGSVLDGTAGRYAGMEIELFADSMKEVELFLLNHHIPYRQDEKSYRLGNEKYQVPLFMLETEIGPVCLVVFSRDDLRVLPKKSKHGNGPERVSLSALSSLYPQS
jgi:hypothetical protein